MGYEHPQIWRIGPQVAVLIGMSEPERAPGCYFRAESEDETPFDAMRRQTGWLENGNPFTPFDLAGRHYHPRLARPVIPADNDRIWGFNAEPNFAASSAGQAGVLAGELARICRVVNPAEDTLQVYGHDIRNLLVLAATEVEMHCRGVLLANGARDRRFRLEDYMVLQNVMKLPEYRVRFPAFPWLDPIQPFTGWTKAQAPGWWSAYNGVKHNREREFQRATLGHAFEAVTACIILIYAQFGGAGGFGIEASLSNFFDLCEKPDWSIGECYCGLSDETDRWTPQSHPILAAT